MFDIIIIETVGIGQSEIEIQHVADWVCLVLQPLAGDQIQFMKAGIMEIPDCFVINKADRAAEARASFYALSASLQWIGNLSPAALTDEIGELATSRDTAGRDLDGANERTDGEDGARQPSSGELDSSTAGGPRILCTSAKTGLGIDELASEISRQRGAQTRSMAAKEPYFFEKWVRDEFGRFGLRALAKRGGATGVLAAAGSYDRALRAFHEQILPDE